MFVSKTVFEHCVCVNDKNMKGKWQNVLIVKGLCPCSQSGVLEHKLVFGRLK